MNMGKIGVRKNEVSTQVVLESLKKKSAPLFKKLEASGVSTNQDFEKVSADLKALKALGKEADVQLRTIIDPLKQAQLAAKKLFQPFFDKLDTIEVAKKAEMKLFVDKREAAANKILEAFDEGKIKKVGTVLAKQAELAVSSESASVRKITQLKCIDANKTPKAFLVPDEKAIMAALKEGQKVAGWELEKVNSIAV